MPSPFLFQRIENCINHIVVSATDLRRVSVRVNAPVLFGWVVFDVPLISFEPLRVGLQFQQVVILGGLSYEVGAGINQRLDLTHK